jgi:hypothetical protein
MTAQLFLEIMVRDIRKMKEEIGLYKNETDIWKLTPGIGNSTGTLALHITGNLQHFIGAVLGGTGFVREREREFAERNIAKAELISGLDDAEAIVTKILGALPDEKLVQDFPIEFMGKRSTHQVLIILVSHLSYHLGQVNYHRRLLAVK